MTDDPVTDRSTPDDRAWRTAVERNIRAGDDCTGRSIGLQTSRAEFDRAGDSDATGSWFRTAVRALVVVAVPLIIYTEMTTPSGTINYAGMGIGLVLMVAGGLVHR